MTFIIGFMMGTIPTIYFYTENQNQKKENKKLNDKITLAQIAVMNAKWELQFDYHNARQNAPLTAPSVFNNAHGLLGVQILMNNIATCLNHAADAPIPPSLFRQTLDACDEFAASGGHVTTHIDQYGARPEKFNPTSEPDYRKLFWETIPAPYSVVNFMDYYDAVWALKNQKTK